MRGQSAARATALQRLWQARLASSTARLQPLLAALAEALARPAVVRCARALLTLLLGLWLATSVWQLLWSVYPEAPALAATVVINPPSSPGAARRSPAVDIEALVAANLFGQPGQALSEAELAAASGRAPTMSEAEATVALAGIEDGAPQTRLALLLRGVLASSEAGLGQAVIEHQGRQDLYQVGDKLPVGAEVVLAKVLPGLVVLDNGGRYEVLRLFEEPALATRVAANFAAGSPAAPAVSNRGGGGGAAVSRVEQATLAARYREQLYDNPESLTDVVQVAPVREAETLRGYRLMPGRASREFAALGLRPGDVVTQINGLSLSEPSNTVRLYQDMRAATRATFTLERDGGTVTLDIDLSDLGPGAAR